MRATSYALLNFERCKYKRFLAKLQEIGYIFKIIKQNRATAAALKLSKY